MGLLLVQVSGVGGVNVVHNVIVVESGAPERQLEDPFDYHHRQGLVLVAP